MFGGAREDRTPDLVIANDALSQLSYGPVNLIVWIVAGSAGAAGECLGSRAGWQV